MTKTDENTEPEETETDDDLRTLIREEIAAVLKRSPAATKPAPAVEDDEPISLRAVEASVRQIVEEAMEPLRAAQAATKKRAPAKVAETAPTPVPVKADTKTRIQNLLWGKNE